MFPPSLSGHVSQVRRACRDRLGPRPALRFPLSRRVQRSVIGESPLRLRSKRSRRDRRLVSSPAMDDPQPLSAPERELLELCSMSGDDHHHYAGRRAGRGVAWTRDRRSHALGRPCGLTIVSEPSLAMLDDPIGTSATFASATVSCAGLAAGGPDWRIHITHSREVSHA